VCLLHNSHYSLRLPRPCRYAPFNGGIGAAGLAWARREVVAARERGDRIIVLSHIPIHAAAASHRTVLFDGDELKKVRRHSSTQLLRAVLPTPDPVRCAAQLLHEEGCGRVVAVFAGHNHRGGYACDSEGMHHVTLESPLTHEQSFGYIDVFGDRLEVAGGGGAIPSRSLRFPPLHRVSPRATPSAKL
jgi:manganese-dependent ADP-ribose/CDP-alcohol diphosphatase